MNPEEYDYSSRIDEIWRTGEALGLSSSEVHNVFTAVLAQEEAEEQLQRERADKEEARRRVKVLNINAATKIILKSLVCFLRTCVCFLRVLVFCMILCFLCCAVISLHNPTRKLVTRNIQDLIYPVMTTLRHLTLPILRQYPQLSQWYSEECLVPNVFFSPRNVDCSSCAENVELIKVSNLNNFTNAYYNNGKFVIITNVLHRGISLIDLLSNVDIQQEIKLGAWKQFSKSSSFSNSVEQLRTGQIQLDTHIEWKINKLENLHKIRQIFPRPYFIPRETEVALHRFMFIDGPQSDSYPLPITEFANVVVMQGVGESGFAMLPSRPCRKDCNPVNVTLEGSQVLFYNWIYWRPERLKSRSFSTFAVSSFY